MTSGSPTGLWCPNGHVIDAGAAFCPACGAAIIRPYEPVAEVSFGYPVDPSVYAGTHAAPQVAPPAYSPAAYGPPEYAQPAYGPPAVNAPPLVVTAVRWNRRRLLAGACALLVVMAGGVAAAMMMRSGPSQKTVTGEFVLTDSETVSSGCEGQGGYSDITAGVSVILTNQTGKILGSSVLGQGTADTSEGTCTYNFSITGVPTDQAEYALEVSHRGKVINSKAEMQNNGWTFQTSMG